MDSRELVSVGTAAHTDPAGDRQWKAQLARAASRRTRAEAGFYAVADVAEYGGILPDLAGFTTDQDTVAEIAAMIAGAVLMHA